MGTDNRKGERTLNVTDRPVELQSMLQTILTFFLLGVMSWVGITLEKVKDNTAENNKDLAVFSSKQVNLENRLTRHINNKRVHRQ